MNNRTRPLLAALVVLLAVSLAAQEAEPDPRPQAETPPSPSAFADPPGPDAQTDPEQGELTPFADQPAAQARRVLGRTTIVPWAVDVLGKEFESFPNDEASRVLTDWLFSSLIDFKIFDVVSRDRLQAVLSEQQPQAGAAEDVSLGALASAGKLLKANYVLFASCKNLGETSEVGFKLLDVESATYSHLDAFTIPFNPAIEEMKDEIDRIVAALAAEFPLAVRISEILDAERLLLGAGTEDGIGDAMEVEVWPLAGGDAPAGRGFVTRCDATQAEVELDHGVPQLNVFDYLARVKVVPPAQAALTKGLRDLARGNYREAAAVFEKGLAADPDNGLLHANYARSRWRGGDYERAVGSFRTALGLLPDDVALLEDTTAAMLESGHAEEVIAILEQGRRRDGSHELTLRYGQAQEVLGYRERARDAYESALQARPESAEAHLRLAVLAGKRGELEEAERQLGRVRELGGDALEMELAIASFSAARSAPGEASGRLAPLVERALTEKDFAALAAASEVILVQPPLWELSLELARHSLGLNPAYLRATVAAARAAVAGARRAEAVALIDDALRVHPTSVALLLLSGELAAAAGNLAEAESLFRQAQDLAEDDWRGAAALGDVYTLQQDHARAAGAYQEALERAESRAAADLTTHLYKSGKAAVLAGRHETARPYLERCVAGAPDHEECQYHLGLCYFAQDSPEVWDRAIASFTATGGLGDSFYYLGALSERQESFEDALSWYRQCVEAQCAAAEPSQARIDLIESITGTVTALGDNGRRATLDVGQIRGVSAAQEGFLVQGSQVVGKVRVEAVHDKTSVAVVLRGNPTVGQTLRFRPTRPREVSVAMAPTKGVLVRWRANPEPEVDYYEVLQSATGRGGWRAIKKVRPPDREHVDKSVKPGSTYYYKVVAVNEAKTRSRDSDVVSIEVK